MKRFIKGFIKLVGVISAIAAIAACIVCSAFFSASELGAGAAGRGRRSLWCNVNEFYLFDHVVCRKTSCSFPEEGSENPLAERSGFTRRR